MSLRRSDVAIAFATFETVGCRAPPSHGTDEGLDFALRVWCSVLDDLDREELLELVVAYSRSAGSRWWPTPGELLALRNVVDDDALEQWGRLRALCSTRGRANPPTLCATLDEALQRWEVLLGAGADAGLKPWALSTDPDVAAALRAGIEALGGWRQACLMDDRNSVANRAAFRDAYRSARSRVARGIERRAVAAITAGPMPALLELKD